MNKIQEELDKAEEYVLNKLFVNANNPIVSSKIQMFCLMHNIDIVELINDKLKMYEDFSKNFMTEEGYYDGKKLTSVLSTKYPTLTGLEIPTMKPIDFL